VIQCISLKIKKPLRDPSGFCFDVQNRHVPIFTMKSHVTLTV